MNKFFWCLLLTLSLTSCIEIFDEISMKNDGSGTFSYKINLSSSKLKVNSILALDSLDGKKVPSINEIKDKINKYKELLAKKEGISNVKTETNFNEFILKFQCDFTSVLALQKAVKEVFEEESKSKTLRVIETNWLVWENNKLIRSIPSVTQDFTSKLKREDLEALKTGKYFSISRFEKPIEKFDNPLSIVSPNKLNILVKNSTYSLIKNLKLLENTIYLSDSKKQEK
jgi:hypothetical protein